MGGHIFKTAVHMPDALAGCRRALVCSGSTIHTLLAQMGVESTAPLVEAPFRGLKAGFSQGECSSAGEP